MDKGKTLKDYFQAIGLLLAMMAALSIFQYVARLLALFPASWFEPVGLLKIALIAYAGWHLVRKKGYSLRETLLPGLMLFAVANAFTYFFLPENLSQAGKAISFALLLAINLAIYSAAMLIAGFAARRMTG